MARKLLLYFAAEARALYRWRGSGPQLERHLAPGDEGLAELRAALERSRGALLHVVTDLAGEDFREEKIPLLRGAERALVIERRLAQRYGEARLATALSLGTSTEERRNERLLLVSQPQSAALTRWLEAVQRAPVTLASVVSTALLAPALARCLGIHRGNCLLVSSNSAGLRQSLLEDGRLRFSRLEPACAGAASAEFVRREIERTLQYLEDSRALSAARLPLEVTLLVPQAEHARFTAALGADERLAFAIHGVPGTDSLYLRLAALRPPAEQFLRGAQRRPFLAWRLHRAFVALGASAFAACAVYAGHLSLEGRTVRGEIAALRQQIAQLRAEEQRLRAEAPQAPANAGAVKAAALEFRRIVAASASPDAAFAHLSAALDQAPEVELDALSWERNDAGGEALEVSARLQASPHAEYSEIGRRIERFSGLLAADEWKVAATRMPFDAVPQGPLAGDLGTRETAERTHFSIALARAPR